MLENTGFSMRPCVSAHACGYEYVLDIFLSYVPNHCLGGGGVRLSPNPEFTNLPRLTGQQASGIFSCFCLPRAGWDARSNHHAEPFTGILRFPTQVLMLTTARSFPKGSTPLLSSAIFPPSQKK